MEEVGEEGWQPHQLRRGTISFTPSRCRPQPEKAEVEAKTIEFWVDTEAAMEHSERDMRWVGRDRISLR